MDLREAEDGTVSYWVLKKLLGRDGEKTGRTGCKE